VKASSRDKRRKTWSKGITATERREMLRANGFSRLIRRPLNTTLDFPCHLTDYPTESLDAFFGGLRTRISTWLQRKRIGTYWVWTRENYKGERREHLHMVLHLPVKQREELAAELEAYVRGLARYKGSEAVVRVGERTTVFNPATGRWEDGLQYRMKQLRGAAVGPIGPTRLNRETRSRRDGAPVAPVLGKRCGISDSLSAKAEQRWRSTRAVMGRATASPERTTGPDGHPSPTPVTALPVPL
jgi:hypothetical protein